MMGTKVFYRKWIPGLLLAAVAYSCDVHEFPKVEPEQAGFTLHLEFETDLPLHQVVDHTTRAEDPSMQCDIRIYDQRLLLRPEYELRPRGGLYVRRD